jgi:menaquinone-dependent protoporphyrinogen IX oxidase
MRPAAPREADTDTMGRPAPTTRRYEVKIEYVHASRYGNGVMVAEEFRDQMAPRSVEVDVHSIHDVGPDRLPQADLYLFSSPGRYGNCTRQMRRFLRKVELPAGTRYAILTTELPPRPDKKTGKMPTDREIARWQHVSRDMNEVLVGKGLVEVTEDKVFVTGLKGPLEEGWRNKVRAFAERIPIEH